MAEAVQWAGRSGGMLSVPTTDAPLPELNDTCPECGTVIVDGAPWRLDPEESTYLRVHVGCLSKRAMRRAHQAPGQGGGNEQSQDAEPSSGVAGESDSADQATTPLESARRLARAAVENANIDQHAAILQLATAFNELLKHIEVTP